MKSHNSNEYKKTRTIKKINEKTGALESRQFEFKVRTSGTA